MHSRLPVLRSAMKTEACKTRHVTMTPYSRCCASALRSQEEVAQLEDLLRTADSQSSD